MKRPAILLLGLLAVPLGVRAQQAAPQLEEDPRAPKFHEIERGFFTGFEVGYLALLKTPVADQVRYRYAGTEGGSSNGFVVGASAGVDIGPRLSVSFFALGGNASAPGQDAQHTYGGFDVLAAGGDLRVAVFAFRDVNDVERVHLYLHGRGGYLRTYPDGLFGNNDILIAGGPGIEYFTRLRHFSVALGGDFIYIAKAKVDGFTVVPSVRYTF